MDGAFKGLEATPDWPPNSHRAELNLFKYDIEIPENHQDLTRRFPNILPVSVATTVISEAPEYADPAVERREQLYVASYEDGSRLYPQSTEAVIRILALLAAKSSGANS